MLRPTESPTLFLQQLGRGLRKSPARRLHRPRLRRPAPHASSASTVAFARSSAAHARTWSAGRREASRSFRPAATWSSTGLPPKIVLRSIKDAIPTRWPAKVHELRALHATRPGDVEPQRFLREPASTSRTSTPATALVGTAATPRVFDVAPPGPHETALRRGVARLAARRRPTADRDVPKCSAPTPPVRVSSRELEAAAAANAGRAQSPTHRASAGPYRCRQRSTSVGHPQVRARTRSNCSTRFGRVDHVHRPGARPDVPLQVHARYTRREILAASAIGADARRRRTWQTGVYAREGCEADLLRLHPRQDSGNFSPPPDTADYAISPDLIHWESQSTTRADSATGRDTGATGPWVGRSCSSLASRRTIERSGSSAQPRIRGTRRTADGHHVEAGASSAWRPLRRLRRLRSREASSCAA